ncbi:MAG: tyrosine-type recombinase/integrase [Candidatus Thorarchaeota archaeon]|jgi:integrase
MAYIRKHLAKDGKVTWRAAIRRKEGTSYATFPTRKQAQEWATLQENAILNQKYFPHKQTVEHTVGEAIDRYLCEILPQKAKGSQDKQHQVLQWWKGNIGDTYLNHVTPELIDRYKYILWQDKGFSEYTVNLYLSTISHVFTVACSPTWKWLRENPCRHVKKLREDRDRLPNVEDWQLEALLMICENSKSPYLYPFVVLALGTGGRKREILDLKWRQVDFQNSRITFENTKSKRRRTIPVDLYCMNALRKLSWETPELEAGEDLDPEGYVFLNPDTGKPVRTLFVAWKSAVDSVRGLKGLRIHDLRHLFATFVATKGKGDIGVIADLLGHANVQQTRRYTHLTESHTAEIVQRMAQEVFHSRSKVPRP